MLASVSKPSVDLASTLETQHLALADVVTDLEKALKAQDLPGLREPLARLRAMLDAHIHLENTQFYPQLLAMAEASGNASTRQLAQLFWDNMKRIAEGVLDFFARHDKAITDHAAFKKEWRTVLGVLIQRMADEEQTLHPLYRRLLGERR